MSRDINELSIEYDIKELKGLMKEEKLLMGTVSFKFTTFEHTRMMDVTDSIEDMEEEMIKLKSLLKRKNELIDIISNEKVKFVKSEKLYSPFLIMKDKRLHTEDKILELNNLNMISGRGMTDKKMHFDYLRFTYSEPIGTLEDFMKDGDDDEV